MENNNKNKSGKATKIVLSKIIETNFIIEGSIVIVGFSGGPDSLCLLHALTLLRERIDFRLCAVHVNHHLRGEKSNIEEKRAREICEELDVEFFSFEFDCEDIAKSTDDTVEGAGRKVRYLIFDEVADMILEETSCSREDIMIATAHNADDQSETVLFRLIRGTGLNGLAGIRAVRFSEEGNAIVRPLIFATREEIEAYIEENRLQPNIDESNFELDATRNKIRHMLIPYIEKKFNPSIKESLRRFADNATSDNDFLEDLTLLHLDEMVELIEEEDGYSARTYVDAFYSTHPSLIYRGVKEILERLIPGEDISYEHIRNVVKLGSSDNPSAYIDLPGGFIAKRDYRNLIFTKKNKINKEDLLKGLRLGTQIMEIRNYCPLDGEVYAAFDYDAFNKQYQGKAGHIKLRTRQAGDYIAMKDGKHKKIQDFFVDSKISKDERDSIILAAIDSEVLWVLPNKELPTESMRKKGKFSQNYQITDTTKRVLFLEIIDSL